MTKRKERWSGISVTLKIDGVEEEEICHYEGVWEDTDDLNCNPVPFGVTKDAKSQIWLKLQFPDAEWLIDHLQTMYDEYADSLHRDLLKKIYVAVYETNFHLKVGVDVTPLEEVLTNGLRDAWVNSENGCALPMPFSMCDHVTSRSTGNVYGRVLELAFPNAKWVVEYLIAVKNLRGVDRQNSRAAGRILNKIYEAYYLAARP